MEPITAPVIKQIAPLKPKDLSIPRKKPKKHHRACFKYLLKSPTTMSNNTHTQKHREKIKKPNYSAAKKKYPSRLKKRFQNSQSEMIPQQNSNYCKRIQGKEQITPPTPPPPSAPPLVSSGMKRCGRLQLASCSRIDVIKLCLPLPPSLSLARVTGSGKRKSMRIYVAYLVNQCHRGHSSARGRSPRPKGEITAEARGDHWQAREVIRQGWRFMRFGPGRTFVN